MENGEQSLVTNVATKDGFAVVSVAGRIVRENQGELRAKLEDVVAGGVGGVALDLSGVTYMDSAGLGCCAAVRKLMRTTNAGALVVFGLVPEVQKMWKLIRLDLAIPILPDEAASLAHLAESKPAES